MPVLYKIRRLLSLRCCGSFSVAALLILKSVNMAEQSLHLERQEAVVAGSADFLLA